MITSQQEHTPVIWINARFLTRAITGVERVAFEIISALVQHHLDANGQWHGPCGPIQFQLMAPQTSKPLPNPWPSLPMKQIGHGHGHVWEQTVLPFATRHDGLINLCNTGPMFKRRQWMFLHDAQTFAIPKNFTPALRYWYQALFRISGHFSAGVLTNSKFSAKELSHHAAIAPERITVAPLGADHMGRGQADFTQRLQSLMTALDGKPFVLAVSSASPNKNFLSVIAALSLLGQNAPECVIVGQRYDRVFANSQLNTDRVHELGYVTDGELIALYQSAGLLIYPSFYEGFGLPPLEAMWHGCPVIASNTSALPEVCADAAVYCDPHQPQTLSEAITRVMQDADLRQGMRIRGREHARKFLWSQTVLHVLDSLIHSGKPRSHPT
ncbi:MAG: glycosyltransferase family 4 protein [Limnohabitans sp.]